MLKKFLPIIALSMCVNVYANDTQQAFPPDEAPGMRQEDRSTEYNAERYEIDGDAAIEESEQPFVQEGNTGPGQVEIVPDADATECVEVNGSEDCTSVKIQ